MRLFSQQTPKVPALSSDDLLKSLSSSKNFVDKSNINNMLETFKKFTKSLSFAERKTSKLLTSRPFNDALRNWVSVIPYMDADQTTSLAITLGYLRNTDKEIWDKLEKHIQRKILKKLDHNQVVEIAKANNLCDRKSESLWNSLESYISNSFYPDKPFDAQQLVQIYYDFKTANQGSAALSELFYKNMLSVASSINSKDINKLIFVLSKDSYIKEDLSEAISKRSSEVVAELDAKTLMYVTSFMIKNNSKHHYLSIVENEIIEKLNLFALNQLSYIVFYYAKFSSPESMKTNNRIRLMKAIEDRLFTSRKILVENYRGEDLDNLIAKIMWGLCKQGVMSQKKLWKDYGKEITENPNLQKGENIVFLRDVKTILYNEGLFLP